MSSDRKDDEELLYHLPSDPSKKHNLLIRLSRNLGDIATKSFSSTRSFLLKEITIKPSEKVLPGFPSIKLVDKQQMEGGVSQVIRTDEGVKKIAEQSHEIIVSANTFWPITIFPDTVLMDRTKITIIRRDFFWSSDTLSIRIEDVLNVSAAVGPVFGSLTIASRVMSTIDHFQINFFLRRDAKRLKRIIQGYVIAIHNNIPVSDLSRDELVKMCEEVGYDANK